ncbi:hypothetical protein [Parasedimentitalea maritima]|uniref:Uncharacterized protein n=1 Tax=Parasedimentitalea maritima TaxID=2578117 RepID=A0A6A4R6L2_9RHOB|nr:hypothetical protein [Zongyanglinia marina]KAE9625500.1 hypothetical protein GP644_22555 [Zongyanglinia marina]
MSGTLFERRPDDPSKYYFVYGGDAKSSLIPGLLDLNGPIGNVSFYSQQRRGFYVASLVKQYLESEESCKTACKSVLIIGAGLSGATCYLALKALGVEGVVLAEISNDALTKQEKASHRYAHPSLAEWPLAETFNSTTNLPFLNWHSGPIDEVVEQIKRDDVWEKHLGKPSQNSDLLFSTFVTTVTPHQDHFLISGFALSKDRRRVELLSNSYACVVFATGYQEYEEVADYAGYWEENRAERATAVSDKNLGRSLLVVGNGDGAIIELGNIYVEDSRIEPLLVKVVSELRDEHVRTFDDPKNPKKSDFEIDFKNILDTKDRDPEEYKISINKALRPKANEITKVLENKPRFNYSQSDTKAVLLAQKHPFESNKCSPISLLAYTLLLDRNCFEYWGKQNNRIQLQHFRLNYPEVNSQASFDDSQFRHAGNKRPNYFFRHFARTKIGLLGYKNPEERNSDIGLGSEFGEGVYKTAQEQGTFYLEAMGIPACPLDNGDEWTKYKLRLSKKYCDHHFTGSEVSRRGNETLIYLDFYKHRNAYQKMGGFDFELYGEKVHYRDKSKMTRVLSLEISDENEGVVT